MIRIGAILLLLSCGTAFVGAEQEAEADAPPVSQQAMVHITHNLILPLLADRKAVNDLLTQNPSAAELRQALQQRINETQLHYHRLAVVNHSGEVLACEPPDETRYVSERPLYQPLLQQIRTSGKELFSQARINAEQHLTYDIFLPLRRDSDNESEVIGFFHANLDPVPSMRTALAPLDLPANEAIYLLTEQNHLLFSTEPEPALFLDLLDPELREVRGGYRTHFRQIVEQPEGERSLHNLGPGSTRIYRHDLTWRKILLSGTTWTVLHDAVTHDAPSPAVDAELTGSWSMRAVDRHEPDRSVGIIHDDSWWQAHIIHADWSLLLAGRKLGTRLIAKRIELSDPDNRSIMKVDGRYDPATDIVHLLIYWQYARRDIRVRAYRLHRSQTDELPASPPIPEIELRMR